MQSLDEERWRSIALRQPDDRFVFGVRTTGVFCRSGCPARTPKKENITLFARPAEARDAGFRACKRCAPDAAHADAALVARIERAARTLANEADASLAQAAHDAGLSRFHFQRSFRRIVGVTPGAYLRDARARRLRDALRGGTSVTDAIYDAGFGSSSAVYSAAPLGMSPRNVRAGGKGETLRYASAACSLGWVLAAVSARGVCAIEIADTAAEAEALLAGHFPHAARQRADDALRTVLADVVAVVDDGAPAASLGLDVRGTAFQQRVWKALSEIEAGSTATYASVARAIGEPHSARAVAAACAANRLAIAVPCHRVVREDGDLAGYRWGVERKRALLTREKAAHS